MFLFFGQMLHKFYDEIFMTFIKEQMKNKDIGKNGLGIGR